MRIAGYTFTHSARPYCRVAALMSAIGLGLLLASAAQAQTFQVIHNFTGHADGGNPLGRLSVDSGGHLYGSTYSGGIPQEGGYGIVFRMARGQSGWTLSPIYTFQLTDDGGDPYNGVQFGPDGQLYGSTSNGGSIFNVRPQATRPPSALTPWNLRFLTDFNFYVFPAGDLEFNNSGNIYGVTVTGGNNGCFNNEGCGMVYELTPSGGSWSQQPLYIFQGGSDGDGPEGIVFDSAGDLIGTTSSGGAYDGGTIFQLTRSGSGWAKSIIYNFDCSGENGCDPLAGLTPDGAGNFYGSTFGSNGDYSGVIFELSPSNGGWTFTKLAQIPLQYQLGPSTPLTLDAAGNLYGTIGTRNSLTPGAVFKVTHGDSGWTYTSLHDFTGGSDGGSAASTVGIDAQGNLYGTTYYGGQNGSGVVWEITP